MLLFSGVILIEEGVLVDGGLALPREELSSWQPFVISCFIWECPLTQIRYEHFYKFIFVFVFAWAVV